jgi:hypothetical protein
MTQPGREARASDADRNAAAERLRGAQSDGRLTVAEYDARLGKVYEAVTVGQLADLFHDLPVAPVQPMAPPQYANQFPQPMAGPIAGPASVVQTNVVVAAGPTVLPNSGWAVAGMVFGIIALIGFWVPVGDIGFSGLAILFSIIGLVTTAGGTRGGRGMAIGGLICGVISIIPVIIFLSIIFSAAAAVTP